MNNLMNGLLPFLIAKQQLKKNGIEATPTGLMVGLIPGIKVPLLHQFILNKAVVEGEIANKEKEQVLQDTSGLSQERDTAVQNLTELKDEVKANFGKAIDNLITSFKNAQDQSKETIRSQVKALIDFVTNGMSESPTLQNIAKEVLAEKDNDIKIILTPNGSGTSTTTSRKS